MADLTEEQKTRLEAVKTKIDSGEELSADDQAFLTESADAIADIPAEE